MDEVRTARARRVVIRLHPGDHAGLGGEIGDDRRQIEVAVGHVPRDHSARRQLVEIERQRLAGHQVHRYGIGAERVQDQQIVGCLRAPGRQTGIAGADLGIGAHSAR